MWTSKIPFCLHFISEAFSPLHQLERPYHCVTNLYGVGEERGHTMLKLGWKWQFLDGRFFSERLLDGTSAQILEWSNHFCDPQSVDVTSRGHEQAAVVVPPR